MPSGWAQPALDLPPPGQMIELSPGFAPLVLKGMTIHPDDPLLFDFIVDGGQSALEGQALTDATTVLVKYFLAGLAVPEKDLWVNLSPKEKDRIMPDALSHTDVGRALLAQDYILKQVTSSLMYPEKDLGKKFWEKVYQRTYEKFGNVDVPVDTFNKVWISPAEAVVYENGNNAFVAEARLKVMLETDHLAAQALPGDAGLNMKTTEGTDGLPSDIAKQVVREVILPVLEKEVNEGQNFALLRQVFHSMILAGWYKNALKESLLGQVYANTNKVAGIEIPQTDAREKVYAQYMAAYQTGVYNYVREEFDRNAQDTVAHKYFAGGVIDLAQMPNVVRHDLNMTQRLLRIKGTVIQYAIRILGGARDADLPPWDVKEALKRMGAVVMLGVPFAFIAALQPWMSGADIATWKVVAVYAAATAMEAGFLYGLYRKTTRQYFEAMAEYREKLKKNFEDVARYRAAYRARLNGNEEQQRSPRVQFLMNTQRFVAQVPLVFDLLSNEGWVSGGKIKGSEPFYNNYFEKIVDGLRVDQLMLKLKPENFFLMHPPSVRDTDFFQDTAFFIDINRQVFGLVRGHREESNSETFFMDELVAGPFLWENISSIALRADSRMLELSNGVAGIRYLIEGMTGVANLHQTKLRAETIREYEMQWTLQASFPITETRNPSDNAQGASDMSQKNGGIDLGQGDYLRVVADKAGEGLQFDPQELMRLQKDLHGAVPEAVSLPVPADLGALVGAR